MRLSGLPVSLGAGDAEGVMVLFGQGEAADAGSVPSGLSSTGVCG